MTVYLLHFDEPIGNEKHTASHYIGFSQNGHTLKRRIAHHQNGTSRCAIMRALYEKDIAFTLARVFKKADRTFERKLKNTKNAARYCPVCNPNAPAYQPKESHD